MERLIISFIIEGNSTSHFSCLISEEAMIREADSHIGHDGNQYPLRLIGR